MPRRRRKKKNRFPLVPLVFFLFLGGSGYLAYSYPDKTHELIKKHGPTVKSLGSRSLTTSKTVLSKTSEYIKDFRSKHKTEKSTSVSSDNYSPNLDDLRLCSFNVRIYSNKSRNDEELEQIAELLDKCDITAIQELRDEAVLQRTIHMLRKKGYHYDYQISDKVGRGVKERYAFLYNPKKVKPVKKARLYNDEKDVFIREPYYATFKSGNFDFTLLTIHLLYGKNEAERRPELGHLADVYAQIRKENPQEKDVIVLGDFNFDPDDHGWKELKSNDRMVHLIKPPSKTTITDTSLYDNIWFQEHYTKEYLGKSGIIKFDETMFGGDDRQAKLAVSDHRPIWALFKTAGNDDD